MTDAVRSREAGPNAVQRALVAVRTRIPRLDAFERVFYGGLLLTAGGLAQVQPWLALAVPGTALSIVALILKLRRP